MFLIKLCLCLEIKKEQLIFKYLTINQSTEDIYDKTGVDGILEKLLNTFPLNGEKKIKFFALEL